jgi:hypothetical protein
MISICSSCCKFRKCLISRDIHNMNLNFFVSTNWGYESLFWYNWEKGLTSWMNRLVETPIFEITRRYDKSSCLLNDLFNLSSPDSTDCLDLCRRFARWAKMTIKQITHIKISSTQYHKRLQDFSLLMKCLTTFCVMGMRFSRWKVQIHFINILSYCGSFQRQTTRTDQSHGIH